MAEKASTFHYIFHYKPQASATPEWVDGATESEDLPFFRGLPIANTEVYSEAEVDLSMRTLAYVTNFLKTG